ncbi:MAG: hypothetical protein NUV82_03495 [Candidatus Komeilibacteria bacterium]|nr:hypothetical protein [Candidatus Komeilibacteria bacterium]
MNLIPLISLPLIFLAVVALKPKIKNSVSLNICAVCIAVAGTWLLLGALYLAGYAVSLLSLGILMGMSATGLMYRLEKVYQQKQLRYFWVVRGIIIIGGYYTIWFLLTEQISQATLLIIISLLGIIVMTFIPQSTTLAPVPAGNKHKNKNILNNLDNCC